MMSRSTAWWWVVALAMIAGGPVPARAGFSIQDLGTVYPTHMSGAMAINANGATAGMIALPSGVSVAASSQPGGPLQQVTTPYAGTTSMASAINDGGDVAGCYKTANAQQLGFYSSATGPTAINTLVYGLSSGTMTQATGINDSGQVVGYGNLGSVSSRAFIVNGGTTAMIAPLGGGNAGTSLQANSANGINSTGVVVGSSEIVAGGQSSAYFTGLNNTPMALATRNGVGNFQSSTFGMAIANNNDIVGYGLVGGSDHAFYAASGGGSLVDLGTLANSPNSMALGVNDNALVVGTSGGEAFLYGGPGLFNLNSLISTVNQAQWLLTSATGINDADQICGEGYLNGVLHAFELTPIAGESIFATPGTVPAPPSLMTSAIGVAVASWWSLRRFRRGRTEVPAAS